MSRRESLAAALLVLLVLVLVAARTSPLRLASAEEGRAHVCPVCGDEVEEGWSYCAWCGARLAPPVPTESDQDRDPKETVLAFFQAYRKAERDPEGARRDMDEVLDLESILGEWIGASLERWEGLSSGLRGLMRRRALPRMAKAMAPIVLELLTSSEMLKTYPPDIEITHDFLKPYKLVIKDERASLYPPSWMVGRGGFAEHTFELSKKGGSWRIIKMPFLVK